MEGSSRGQGWARETQRQSYSSDEVDEVGNLILSKGMGLGKKLLVTGLVISSAPFLLPPLLILSTVGFVCSVPCGVLWASYACTRQLMSKLLPVPAPDGHAGDGNVDNDEETQSKYPKENDGEQVGDDKVEIEFEARDMGGESSNDISPQEKNQSLAERNKGDETKNTTCEQEDGKKRLEKEQEDGKKVEDVGISPENRLADGNREMEKSAAETDHEVDDESRKQAEDKTSASTSERPDSQSDQEKSAEITSATGMATTDESNAKSESAAPPQEASQGGPESQISSKDDIGESSSSDKATYSEGKTWEQIRAVRAIVGYTATPKSTCAEEVKALYLFTGVEPPASFQDSSLEIDHKLRFLMSIIGVK